MMNMMLLQLAIFALLICLIKSQNVTMTATESEADTVIEETTEIASSLLEAVLRSDRDMLAKALSDGDDIDVVNVNGW